jgi:hypothetical protein
MTSIEFLFNELWESSKDKLAWHTIFNKAKEMHKKEIIDALNEFSGETLSDEFCDKYYQETYGSKGSDEAKNDSAKCGIIDNVDYWEKTLEYWKAEKEISNIGSTYYGLCCARIGIIEDFFKSIQLINTTSSKTEISDEEIEDKAIESWMKSNYDNPEEYRDGWINAIKYYREQLKQRQ